MPRFAMEAVIFIGLQGAGKSTFYKEYFFQTHVRINLDMLRTRHREDILLSACIDAKQPFVVDNTNITRDQRVKYIEAARQGRFRVVAYYFDVGINEALTRNSQRTGRARVPDVAIYGAHKRLEPPRGEEGFDRIFIVRTGTDGRFQVTEIDEKSTATD